MNPPSPRRPWPVDVALAGAMAVLWVVAMPYVPGLSTPAVLLWGTAFALPLAWRRVSPDGVALALLAPHLIQLLVTGTPVIGNLTVPVMMFTVAAYGRPAFRVWWLAAGLFASVVAALSWTGWFPGGGPAMVLEQLIGLMPPFAALASVVAASWSVGAVLRANRESRRATKERTDAIQAQREQGARLSAAEERQRIAREMHDVVAHSLAVIVVQADGGAYAASSDGDPHARLAIAERTLHTIRTTAHEALGETRRLVGVLRSDAEEWAPTSGLGDLADLIGGLTAAGRDVRLQVTGDPGLRSRLGAGRELAVYRVIQEALTNTVKHAGADARVWVRIDHAPEQLTVAVQDDGPGATGSDGLGHGLIGMRERVAAFGGTLETGNHSQGGYLVVARFPTA